MQQRVQVLHRRLGAFVRCTTPHHGGTLRGKPYSVLPYSTSSCSKCKYLFCKSLPFAAAQKRVPGGDSLDGHMYFSVKARTARLYASGAVT